MAIDILLEVLANSPPAILIALGFVLLLFGFMINNGDLVNAAGSFLHLA